MDEEMEKRKNVTYGWWMRLNLLILLSDRLCKSIRTVTHRLLDYTQACCSYTFTTSYLPAEGNV